MDEIQIRLGYFINVSFLVMILNGSYCKVILLREPMQGLQAVAIISYHLCKSEIISQ